MQQQTADFAERITSAPRRRVFSERELCRTLGEMVAKSARTRIATVRLDLLAHKEIILGRDPQKPLELGYALVWKRGAVVRSAKNISKGNYLSLLLLDGVAGAVVEIVTYDRETWSSDIRIDDRRDDRRVEDDGETA